MLTAQDYQDIIDDDAIPWYRFPKSSEKEKTLSHLTVTGEEPEIPTGVHMQSGEFSFRGEYGTNFQPPGLERNMTWNFLHAKHPPPGLPFPTILPPCFSTPMNFSRSTASAMKSVSQTIPQPAYQVVDGCAVDSADHEPETTSDDQQNIAYENSPPITTVLCRARRTVETTTDPVTASLLQGSPNTYSLAKDLEDLEFEEMEPVTSKSLIVSSDDWARRRRSSQMQESSNENSVMSNPSDWNTPERLISNKSSNLSLESEYHDSRP